MFGLRVSIELLRALTSRAIAGSIMRFLLGAAESEPRENDGGLSNEEFNSCRNVTTRDLFLARLVAFEDYRAYMLAKARRQGDAMLTLRIDTCAECAFSAPVEDAGDDRDAFVCSHPDAMHRTDRLAVFDGIPAWCPLREEPVKLCVRGGR